MPQRIDPKHPALAGRASLAIVNCSIEHRVFMEIGRDQLRDYQARCQLVERAFRSLQNDILLAADIKAGQRAIRKGPGFIKLSSNSQPRISARVLFHLGNCRAKSWLFIKSSFAGVPFASVFRPGLYQFALVTVLGTRSASDDRCFSSCQRNPSQPLAQYPRIRQIGRAAVFFQDEA